MCIKEKICLQDELSCISTEYKHLKCELQKLKINLAYLLAFQFYCVIVVVFFNLRILFLHPSFFIRTCHCKAFNFLYSSLKYHYFVLPVNV